MTDQSIGEVMDSLPLPRSLPDESHVNEARHIIGGLIIAAECKGERRQVMLRNAYDLLCGREEN